VNALSRCASRRAHSLNGGGRSLQREVVLLHLARRAAFAWRGAKAAARMGLGIYVVDGDKQDETNKRKEETNEQHRPRGASGWTAGWSSGCGWTTAFAGRGTTDSVTSRDTGDDLDQIRTAIQALQLYAEGNHDDVELAKVHKAIVMLQSILADHSKNRDAALGTTPAMKHIRRTSGGY
jgi:hypothetical protein